MLVPRDADAGARGLPSAAAPPVGAVPVSGPAQRPRERLADAGGQAQRGQVCGPDGLSDDDSRCIFLDKLQDEFSIFSVEV